MTKPLSTRAFIQSILESQQDSYNKQIADRRESQRAAEAVNFYAESVIGKQSMKKQTQNRYNTFIESVKSILLQECIFKVFKEASDEKLMADPSSEGISRNLISSFIQENGITDLLSDMKKTSLINSSIVSLIENTVRAVKESVDSEDPNTLTLQPSIRDDFFEKLELEDTGDVSDMISQRVAASIDDFVKSNIKDKEKIKDILVDAKEKIDATESTYEDEDDEAKDAVIESHQAYAKRKINKVRSGSQNIFNIMVTEMSKNSMTNPDLKLEFVTEGHIDVPKVVSRVQLMYTFLETVNTMKLAKVDEAYLEEVISSIGN